METYQKHLLHEKEQYTSRKCHLDICQDNLPNQHLRCQRPDLVPQASHVLTSTCNSLSCVTVASRKGLPPGRALHTVQETHLASRRHSPQTEECFGIIIPKEVCKVMDFEAFSRGHLFPHSSNQRSSTLILGQNRSNPGLPHCR